jgi:opacity protein-like surface antigen
MKRLLGLAALAIGFSAPSIAAAETYVKLDLGVGLNSPADISVTADGVEEFSDSEEIESAASVGAAIGFTHKLVRTELQVDFANFDGGDNEEDGTSVSYLSAFGNVFYDVPTQSNFSPYVGGGVGFSRADFDLETEFGDLSDTSTGMAWHVGGGVSFNTGGGVLDVGYRYVKFPAAESEANVLGVALKTEIEPSTHQLTLAYRFGL